MPGRRRGPTQPIVDLAVHVFDADDILVIVSVEARASPSWHELDRVGFDAEDIFMVLVFFLEARAGPSWTARL